MGSQSDQFVDVLSFDALPHRTAAEYRESARNLIEQMTLEEKASLCSGRDDWNTKGIERLGIPSIMMTDGPHGIRKASATTTHEGIPATCFPTASAMAASWNPALIREVGVALGRECQANDVQVLLGPGVNMKRSPLCGRNFEYYSEDPLLAGKIAAAFIQGVQSQGVGTSLKHFAANNQEYERLTNDSIIDERTLREIYLPAFETAVKEAQPWTVMCSYNVLNGVPASHNAFLLDEVLRKQWGFLGLVVSDWGAVTDRVAGVKAGLNLEMPSSHGVTDREIVAAVESGELSEARLDDLVTEFLSVTLRAHDLRRRDAAYDRDAHHALARRVAGESIVLLKNDGGLLPLDLTGTKTIAVIGEFAKTPRIQGGGSSKVNPTRIDNALEELMKQIGPSVKIEYARGYSNDGETDDTMLSEARRVASDADVALLFVGLPDKSEGENYDRTQIDLPEGHNRLVAAVAASQPRTVVVLTNGAAVAMPWVDQVPAMVEGWLCGQAGAGAIADVLTGKVNPSGKLSETFPVRLEDTPTYPDFPGLGGETRYGEGVLIGYRYYDAKRIAPLFPFGHGLSYTTFTLSELTVDSDCVDDFAGTRVHVQVKNAGERFGQEVIQLYVHEQASRVMRPEKELRHFRKVALAPGEEQTITFNLCRRDFAYWDVRFHGWAVRSGKFDILVGRSSRDLPLSATLEVRACRAIYPTLSRTSLLRDFLEQPQGQPIYDEIVRIVNAVAFGPDANAVNGAQKESAAEREKRRVLTMQVLDGTSVYRIIPLTGGHLTEEKLAEWIETANSGTGAASGKTEDP